MSALMHETCRRALDITLDSLIETLQQAQKDMAEGLDNAAIGSLILVDEQHGDLQAALRLYKITRRAKR